MRLWRWWQAFVYHQQLKRHLTCSVCGNCATCNLRPCRTGGPHSPEAKPRR